MGNGFDRIAPIYDGLARLVFGDSIKKVQVHLLQNILDCKRILILGGGTGWLLEEVLTRIQPIEVVYIDLSAKMIQLSRERIEKKCPDQLDKVRFVEGELWDWHDDNHFDAVMTCFYLDLFPQQELQKVMDKIGQLLNPQTGIWLFADFAFPNRGLIKIWAKLVIPFMYGFFRIIAGIPGKRLPDFSSEFHRIGMKEGQNSQFYGGMIVGKSYKPEF